MTDTGREVSAVIGSLREFQLNISDWAIYKARVNSFFSVNNINTTEKKQAILLNMLDEEAYKLIYSLCSPSKPESKAYDDLVKLFDVHFAKVKSPLAERWKFYEAKKMDSEEVREWAARVRSLAVNCEFGAELEVCLRDKFIFGFSRGPILDRLLEEKVSTAFEDVIAVAESKMAALSGKESTSPSSSWRIKEEALQFMRKNVKKLSPIKTKSFPHPATTHQPTRNWESKKTSFPKCGVCGKKNHDSDKCFFKLHTCHICHKKGHISSGCRSKFRNNKTYNNFVECQESLVDHNLSDELNLFSMTENNKNLLERATVANSKNNVLVNKNNVQDHSVFVNYDIMNKLFSSDEESNVNNSSSLTNDIMNNLFSIGRQSQELWRPFEIDLKVESFIIRFQIDSGSSCSVISKKLYERYLFNLPVTPVNTCLIFYTGTRVKPIGSVVVKIVYKKIVNTLKLLILENGGPPIVGRDFLNMYNIGFSDLNYMNEDKILSELRSKFKGVFSPGLGKCNRGVASIKLKNADITPKFFKARPLPFAIKKQVEQEINRMVSLGILEPVDYSPWGTPVVPVFKKDGTVRLCGDFKVTINPFIEVDQHPLPRIEDLFTSLQGGETYSKLDLSQAYQQICVDDNSKQLLTISTHKGLFQYTRLAYGVAAAPAKFQKIIEILFAGVAGVVVFLDDILITGKDKNEHVKNLEIVLSRLQDSGLKLNPDKCLFFQDKVEYLGYVIDSTGLFTSQSKIEAISKTPRPTNVTELKSILGLINYYGRFVNNLAGLLHPLYNLLKKNVSWVWDVNCESAFQRVKDALQSAEVLVHFNPDLPLKLTVDASSYGIAAILSHVFDSGEEKPVAYASRMLNSSEKSYSQIQKEGLAIIFGVLKFNKYLLFKKFTLVTDCKPLLTIFGNKKGIPQYAANRLQRWATILSNYQYDIQYVRSNKNLADALSRLPASNNGSKNEGFEEDAELDYQMFFTQQSDVTINFESIKKMSEGDQILCKVMHYLKHGWPRHLHDTKLKIYYHKRFEIIIHDGNLFWNHRIIVPEALRKELLNQLHATHMGMSKMKNVARSYFWWPGLGKDIENFVKTCKACATLGNSPPKVPLRPWKYPNSAWERIHIDFLGPFYDKHYLVIIDAYTKWLEVFPLTSTCSQTVITVLRSTFARFGLPLTLVSDNAKYFVSEEFSTFLRNNNITHITSPPFHPSSNGAAENSVKTIKYALRKALALDKSKDKGVILSRFLFDYRNAPHSTTGVSPAKLMFQRKLRTRFDCILPNKPIQKNQLRVQQSQAKQIKYYSGNRKAKFMLNEFVLVKDYRVMNRTNWVKGIVRKVIGKCTYLVEICDINKTWKRHANQIKKTLPLQIHEENVAIPTNKNNNLSHSTTELQHSEQTDQNNSSNETERLTGDIHVFEPRPRRKVNPPERLMYN